MLGLWAWSDDLNVILFEFLDDDTKLAQSCRDWLCVQHWYTVVPEPSMRVALWVLVEPSLRQRTTAVFVKCVTTLLSFQLLRTFSVQTPSLSVFSVAFLSRGIA